MRQQMQNNVDTISPSLEAKLRQFADGLTAEEQAQVRALQTNDVTGMLAPSLRDKAQQVADTLTPEEQAQVHLLVERTGVAAPATDEADVEGHRAAHYEDDDGWKGKPGTNPNGVGKGGNSLGQLAGWGLMGLIAIGTVLYPGARIVEGELDARDAYQ
jgi:hypothetical protein